MFKNINDFVTAKINKQKIAMLTAYDFFSGNVAMNAGIDVILVGDSLGMVHQGKSNTLSVKTKDMIYHTNSVARGAPDAFLVVDMPYLSYHTSVIHTLKHAGKIIQKTPAQAVKIEIANLNTIAHIEALLDAQIPVVGHIGLTPQSVNIFGGFNVQGSDEKSAENLCKLALKLQEIGVFAIVLECIPATLAKKITQQLSIPTIGIGSGIGCDGQVLVIDDMLGMNISKTPKFVKQYLNGHELITQAISHYVDDVKSATFPEDKHSFKSNLCKQLKLKKNCVH